ncbi:MAG: hypothetical protein ORO03_09755, partial [Alphaproteobacteria bacterium]|nr:hypothetical protein [Alphaproteobacteria bacterium]
NLTFFEPDPVRFPALRLAREALAAGSGAATVLNAANEVAVAAFLRESIGFSQICAIVEECLAGLANETINSLEDVSDLDREARRRASEEVARRTHRGWVDSASAVAEAVQNPVRRRRAVNRL